MKASFNVDIGRLKVTKDVWFRDATFIDTSGTASFTKSETNEITGILSDTGRLFNQINAMTLNRIAASEVYKLQIKTFNNTKVRAGEEIKNTALHTTQLIKWVEDRMNKEILASKKADTREKRLKEKNEVMRFYRQNAEQLKLIFDLQNKIVQAKLIIIRKLEQMSQVTKTFIRTDDGFRITAPEGFVAVDRLKGNAVKLIDRLEFAHANFTAAKNWNK
jgi:hypothetical protein